VPQTVPYEGGIVPSTGTKVRPAYGPIGAIAQLDGCTGFTVVPSSSPLVTTTQGQGCPSGVQVSLVVSSTLKHQWPTGTTAIPTYGFDATNNLWGFLAAEWATRAAPVAL
jgi:poly(3-hydroxybutyrate) depolymerase